MADYRLIRVCDLAEPPAPVRASIDEIKIVELAESIKQVGILQPLIVIPVSHAVAVDAVSPSGDPKTAVGETLPGYEVVAGHRRLMAARHIGLFEVPCIVYSDAAFAKEAAMLHENVYREDLTAAEEGVFYAELIEKHDLTEDALCNMVRQKPAYIYDRLALVSGDPEVLKACAERRITYAVAKEINRCKDAAQRAYLLSLAERGGATAATVRQWVSRPPAEEATTGAAAAAPEPDHFTPPAPGAAMQCWLCGKDDAPFNLRVIYVCFYELDSIRAILKQAGVEVHPA